MHRKGAVNHPYVPCLQSLIWGDASSARRASSPGVACGTGHLACQPPGGPQARGSPMLQHVHMPVLHTARALSIAHMRPARRASCGATCQPPAGINPGVACGTVHSAPMPRTARALSIGPARTRTIHCDGAVNGPHPTCRALYRSSTARGPWRPGVAYATVHVALYHGCYKLYIRSRFFLLPYIPCDTDFTRPHATAGSAAAFYFQNKHFVCAEKKDAPHPANVSRGFAHILQNPMAKMWTW